MSSGTPLGHGFAMVYGPPDAHVPPMRITARMDRNSTVIEADTPAIPTKSQNAARPSIELTHQIRHAPIVNPDAALTPQAVRAGLERG